MSRNRERAKARKDRLRQQQDPNAEGGGQQHLHRENVPGQLDHASAEVDAAEAAIVEGAGGIPADGLTEAELLAAEQADEAASGERAPAVPAEEREGGQVAAAPGAPVVTSGRAGPRFIQFLRASWAELQRVQWPDRRQVGQGTAVTLGFVVVAGLYLGAADALAKQITELIF